MDGTPNDCKKCACPLEDSTNNFSPTCKSDDDGGYVCTDCPEGYAGDHCEMYTESHLFNAVDEDNINVRNIFV